MLTAPVLEAVPIMNIFRFEMKNKAHCEVADSISSVIIVCCYNPLLEYLASNYRDLKPSVQERGDFNSNNETVRSCYHGFL